MWSSFHTHNDFCDGKGTIGDYFAKAKDLRLVSLGLSSHAPLPFHRTWSMKKENLDTYLAAVSALKNNEGGPQVYTGLEVDFIPGKVSPKEYKPVLDYTIGSIHFVETLPDGTPWEIDNTFSVFEQGYTQIFAENIKDVLWRYFELTREMVETAAPDIVGHLDKIKIQNAGYTLFDEGENWYREAVLRTLDTIAAARCIVEINTRGLYQKKSVDPYPSPWIIELMFRKNIPVTLSSDAHHTDQLTSLFPRMAKLLHNSGYRHLSVLHEGEWRQVKFDEQGLYV